MINKTLPMTRRDIIILGAEMKKVGTILFLISFTFIIFSLSCKKSSEKPMLLAAQLPETEIDIQKIENLTGVQFKILKTKTVGYMPLHRFYWICLPKRVSSQKVNELADSIIKEIITKKPNTYHSFTVHLFWEDELGECVEKSKSFARANFLPEGDWTKVGRVPLDDYEDYALTFTPLD
jgi:hypothetical protein